MNERLDYIFKYLLISISCVIISAFIIHGINYIKGIDKNTDYTRPVESVVIDSVEVINTKLIQELNNIDSIKNAKIIEVKTLDNDSTIRLFYQLLSQ